jgi:hemerythrin-like domain-containing protein
MALTSPPDFTVERRSIMYEKDGKREAQRRMFLHSCGLTALGTTLVAGLSASSCGRREEKEEDEEEVSTNEDLMREHGILKRVLLIYDEVIRRVETKREFPPQAVTDAATIVRKFIEDYHEKLEEDHLFPRFRKAGKLADLVEVLYQQHQAGRRVTQRVLTAAQSLKTAEERSKLADDLRIFVRMYAPHEAREDTVLFPELHKIVSSHEYDALGEQFEKIERQTFGGDGFDIYVDKVTSIEKQLGIYDLAQFTPNGS